MSRLDPANCVLLRDEKLVERYNAVHDVLERAARELPQFGQRDIVADVRGELAKLADTMTRKRFAIGFIGPSQAGKSTTVSNLLSVSEKDSPTPQGGGGPTTSVPTRIVPRPPVPDATNTISLRYFSKAEFRERVRDICDLVKLQYDEDLRRLRDMARTQQAKKPHFKAADHEVLLKLLSAAIEFPDVLAEIGGEEKGDYAQRRIYATHQETPTKYTLLREVRIDFVTDAVNPEVEMIDLPGLGVDTESDDRLTLAYVQQLDGAFMFQHGIQVKAGAVSQLAERMRERYVRTLGERIWMVVTRCDSLNDLQLNGPADGPEQPSMFCHLAELMRQQGIKGHNVIFVGNAYYQDRMAEGLGETEAVSDTLRTRYSRMLQFDANGLPVVPERCSRNDGQVEPWQRFVLDGGIPALRETMQTKVADSVREQTRRDVSERLVGVIDHLTAALQAAEQQSGMTVEEMMRAARWSGELDRLADEIGRDPRYSQEAVAAIEQTLGELIGNWGTPSRGGLAENHEQLTGMLTHAGLHEASKQTAVVVSLVKGEIEQRSRTQPPPNAAGLPTPLEHWANVVRNFLDLGKTTEGRDFREPIFKSIREDPNPFVDNGQNMGATDYPMVMRTKAGRVARVYGSRLVHEIQGHLQGLQSRYRAIGSEIEHIDNDQRERYAQYRTELGRLRH